MRGRAWHGKKPINRRGTVVRHRASGWRVGVHLDGKYWNGPVRRGKHLARADLRRARAAATKADMVAVLTRLKQEAKIAKVNATEGFKRLAEARAAQKRAAKLVRLAEQAEQLANNTAIFVSNISSKFKAGLRTINKRQMNGKS